MGRRSTSVAAVGVCFFAFLSQGMKCGGEDEDKTLVPGTLYSSCGSVGDAISFAMRGVKSCTTATLVFAGASRTVVAATQSTFGSDVVVSGSVPALANGTYQVEATCDALHAGPVPFVIPCAPEAGVPETYGETPLPEKPLLGEIMATVDLGTNMPYATAQLFDPRTLDQANYVKSYLDSLINDVVQPDLADGACAEHKEYPRPTPVFVPPYTAIIESPVILSHEGTPVFTLAYEGEGRYASPPDPALMIPTPLLLDIEIPGAPKVAKSFTGLRRLGLAVPDAAAESLTYDRDADFPISFRENGTMMVRLSGVKTIECKLTELHPDVRVSKADLAKFVSGSILFRHIAWGETFVRPSMGVPRPLRIFSQTTRSMSLVQAPPK